MVGGMRVIAICNNKWFDKEDWNKLNEIQKSLEGGQSVNGIRCPKD